MADPAAPPPAAASSGPIGIGVVGIGKIAKDQHLPVITSSPDYRLFATTSKSGGYPGFPCYTDIGDMLAKEPDVRAVSLCTPPQGRYELAVAAIDAGRDVFLEKPPGATLSEVEALRVRAEARGVVLFASWHSRCAPAVQPARAWIAERTVRRVQIDWREDVRHWHPNQDWVFQPGGMGVFDPGINALSIATRILPPFHLTSAELRVPANRQTPIQADLAFVLDGGAEVVMALDWLQTGPQTWDVRVETDRGVLTLHEGGQRAEVQGSDGLGPLKRGPHVEYEGLYARFAELVRRRISDVDVSPLRQLADAFTLGRRTIVDPFDW